jgi:hypothetical protein
MGYIMALELVFPDSDRGCVEDTDYAKGGI